MIIWRSKNWFDNELQSNRNQFLGSDSEFFFWNGDDLPVDFLFTTLVTLAPVDGTLSVSFDGPVGSLTLFGAVDPLLATTGQFDRQSTNTEAVGAVPGNRLSFLIQTYVSIITLNLVFVNGSLLEFYTFFVFSISDYTSFSSKKYSTVLLPSL